MSNAFFPLSHSLIHYIKPPKHNQQMCTANITLEYLTRREQCMEDIDAIVESFCWEMWEGKYPETQEELTKKLCDAVCKNFHI